MSNLSTNYFSKTEVSEIKTNLQHQITADVNNLSTNYFNKTEVNGIKTNIENALLNKANINEVISKQIQNDNVNVIIGNKKEL